MNRRAILIEAIIDGREEEALTMLAAEPNLFDDDVYALTKRHQCGRLLRYASRTGLLTAAMAERQETRDENRYQRLLREFTRQLAAMEGTKGADK